MESRVQRGTAEIDGLFAQFRISEALMATYKLVWDDLCSWYLESVKTGFVEGVAEPIDQQTYDATVAIFEEVMKLLHPFMPFLSEEVWHLLRERKAGEDIIVSAWPKSGEGDVKLEAEVQHAFELVSAVRNVRNERGMSPKEAVEIQVRSRDSGSEAGVTMRPGVSALVNKLANVSAIAEVEKVSEGSVTFLVGTNEYAVDLGGNIDTEAEAKKAEAELSHLRGFLASVEKKLSNERFVAGAPPQVLEIERKKKADAESKIKALEARLAQLAD